MQYVTLLGATGSIGRSTLDVLERHPDRYRVFALSAHQRIEELLHLCQHYKPLYAVVANASQADWLQARLTECSVLVGTEGLCQVAEDERVGMVMAAIVGAAGLAPTLAAIRAGKKVLLANKESLVMAGALFMAEVQRHGATLLPVDSEHNALFQCMPRPGTDLDVQGVERLVLTASGGPFWSTSQADLVKVTPEQAVQHPRWSMGPKISVDSATMMNKGLELIEACWLFHAPEHRVDICIHPQSIIHSLVQYRDGSTLAQLGCPDMRTPIAVALAWPERIGSGVPLLDLLRCGPLEFSAPDHDRFPCLDLARQAMRAGGTAPAILNAANEVAVAAFLQNETSFMSIPVIISQTLEHVAGTPADSLEAVLDADARARSCALRLLSANRVNH